MIIMIDEKCSLFFGNASNCSISPQSPIFSNFCDDLRKKNKLTHLVIQRQVHGVDGIFINDTGTMTPVMCQQDEGDFVITNQANIGVGVLTADCLPIVFYAPKHNIIAVAHAGWRGSIAQIAEKTIEKILKQTTMSPQDLYVYFGPAAKTCCYEVQPDFLPNLERFSYRDKLITMRNKKLFFDVALLNRLQLIDLGINPCQINEEYQVCTICNPQYHSYRRCKDDLRQVTMGWIKDKK